MTYTVYILYSVLGNKFYTGYTSTNIDERIRKHKSNHKGFTGKYLDWETVFTFKTSEKNEALRLEQKIKKRGAFRFLMDNGYRVTPNA
ncbi:MAG: GIY-YIG nuclease family protein [Flavobacteriales bacterium]|nr:GIY-YIG nuclease family protein [Flavobacteriales bacterium]